MLTNEVSIKTQRTCCWSMFSWTRKRCLRSCSIIFIYAFSSL